jgi:hypothetical protein
LALMLSYYYMILTVQVNLIIMTLGVFILRIYRINKYLAWGVFLGCYYLVN